MPHFNLNSNQFLINNLVVEPIQYTLITGSVQKPITISEVKSFLKIDDDDSDTELKSFIDTVTNKAEQITGRDLITKTYKTYLDCFPPDSFGIEIQKSKLQAITSIKYLVAGVLTTFDASNYYITDEQEYATIWLFDGKTYPTDIDINRKQAVEIIFTAGFGTKPCDIPIDLKSAMLSHVNLLNENRGDCSGEEAISPLIMQLYIPYIVSKKMVCII